ncbi:nuclear RNA export factor 2-like [Anticarsia gemmatalis]|uniref:nuclear RNA export factor 2-like n=1 Tax=Anticarsia gemmatalis TaxID=129554 RepID=UPI003F75D86C
MATERFLFENFKRFLLNRSSVTPFFVDCIENSLTNESETSHQSFHKIMIHNWQDNLGQLFDVLSGYFGSIFIPVNCTSQGELTTFYTSNLTIIMKIIRFDFMFPYCRNMFNVDVLFNDRSATDFFGVPTTIEEIVSGVVCRRFNEKCELDLSNFSEDPEFVSKKIWFYKLSLLSTFKILMLRMGRDTKKLILRNNNLSQAPVDILNFFIKADLTAVDLSYNDIQKLHELHRVSSKIEKLWIEGNPLCEELDPITYVKNVSVKFPRLTELDGIKFNQHGIILPFFRNFLATADSRTKTVVEQFVNLFFSNFDSKESHKRVREFYEDYAMFGISTDFTEAQEELLPHYGNYHRNMLNPLNKKKLGSKFCGRLYTNQNNIMAVYSKWPETVHDKSTFTVDVLCHSKTVLMLVIDGIYKELVGPDNPTENIFQFRRSFLFNIHTIKDNMLMYKIQNEMINVRFATTEQIRNSFKSPIINMNSLSLQNPCSEETDAISKAFQHITQLKKTEAELRLRYHSWNIQVALKDFSEDLRDNKIPGDRFVEEEDFSDTSSLLDEIE